MPRDEKRVEKLLESATARLKEPGTIARVMRHLRLTARMLVMTSQLDSACRGLSNFGLKALHLACEHGRVPEVVALQLDEQQTALVSSLMAETVGRQRIRNAVDAEHHVRIWGRH
jgi:hypothetical protein